MSNEQKLVFEPNVAFRVGGWGTLISAILFFLSFFGWAAVGGRLAGYGIVAASACFVVSASLVLII